MGLSKFHDSSKSAVQDIQLSGLYRSITDSIFCSAICIVVAFLRHDQKSILYLNIVGSVLRIQSDIEIVRGLLEIVNHPLFAKISASRQYIVGVRVIFEIGKETVLVGFVCTRKTPATRTILVCKYGAT